MPTDARAPAATTRPGRPAGPLPRYLLAATMARTADGGAGLGLVLLALAPASHLDHPGPTAGLLVAGLSAPHLAGPFVARRLDRARDGRRVLAIAFAAYAVLLAAGAVLLGRAPLPLVGGCVVLAGTCGPLLTGGLSSRVTDLAADTGQGQRRGQRRAQRRAQGWDAVTYGLGGTAGPALVAATAAVTGALTAVLVLCAGALVAAGLTLTLPEDRRSEADATQALTVRAAIALVARTGPLRRVTYTTMVNAAVCGGLSLLAVTLGRALSSWPSAGATLAATFGAGNLLGSMALTARPLRGEPERLTIRCLAVLSAIYACCAAAPTYLLAVIAFTVAGAANAAMFTATLAARAEYSPPTARAQIFVSVSGLKVGAVAAGTALAGAFVSHGPRTLLGAGAVAAATAVAATWLERHGPGARWAAGGGTRLSRGSRPAPRPGCSGR